MSKTYKHNGLELTVGNTKLGNDTMIFNMGSATDCPSAQLGLCKLGKHCYALKAERMYPQCKPYRERQAAYWLNTSWVDILHDMVTLLTARQRKVNGKLTPLHKTIKWFRFNESGDFWSQDCIEKLSKIAENLREMFGIGTYGYSARSDLDFSQAEFNCKGSGHNGGNNGQTIARTKARIYQAIARDHRDRPITMFSRKVYHVCPMNCRTCHMCKTDQKLNIVFPLH